MLWFSQENKLWTGDFQHAEVKNSKNKALSVLSDAKVKGSNAMYGQRYR